MSCSSGASFGAKNYWLYGTAKSAMIGMANNLKHEGVCCERESDRERETHTESHTERDGWSERPDLTLVLNRCPVFHPHSSHVFIYVCCYM